MIQRASAGKSEAVGNRRVGRTEHSSRLQRQDRRAQAVHALLRRHQSEIRHACFSSRGIQ